MKYPDAHDICEIAAHLFPQFSKLAYEATAIMLLLNNIFLVSKTFELWECFAHVTGGIPRLHWRQR